jgi:hypothetical protein
VSTLDSRESDSSDGASGEIVEILAFFLEKSCWLKKARIMRENNSGQKFRLGNAP